MKKLPNSIFSLFALLFALSLVAVQNPMEPQRNLWQRIAQRWRAWQQGNVRSEDHLNVVRTKVAVLDKQLEMIKGSEHIIKKMVGQELFAPQEQALLRKYSHLVDQTLHQISATLDLIHSLEIRALPGRYDRLRVVLASHLKDTGVLEANLYKALGVDQSMSLDQIQKTVFEKQKQAKLTEPLWRAAGVAFSNEVARQDYDAFIKGPAAINKLQISDEQARELDSFDKKLLQISSDLEQKVVPMLAQVYKAIAVADFEKHLHHIRNDVFIVQELMAFIKDQERPIKNVLRQQKIYQQDLPQITQFRQTVARARHDIDRLMQLIHTLQLRAVPDQYVGLQRVLMDHLDGTQVQPSKLYQQIGANSQMTIDQIKTKIAQYKIGRKVPEGVIRALSISFEHQIAKEDYDRFLKGSQEMARMRVSDDTVKRVNRLEKDLAAHRAYLERHIDELESDLDRLLP